MVNTVRIKVKQHKGKESGDVAILDSGQGKPL